MKRNYLLSVAAAILLLLMIVPTGSAQPCTPIPPPEFFDVGTSHCIKVCAGSYLLSSFIGNRLGPESVPQLIFEAGCQTAHCDVACSPPLVPPSVLIYNGNPLYPGWYYGEGPCVRIRMQWVHDNVWALVIIGLCPGCFCLTFDHQLPVQLSGFEAISGDGEVQLNWATASETGAGHFDLVRDETKIAEVEATNSPTGASYSFTDRGVVNGQSYSYSLIAVDATGHQETLKVLSDVRPISGSGVITTYALYQNYPNPFNPETSIAFDLAADGPVKLVIYNVLGENVATLIDETMSGGRHAVVFNGSRLSTGIYLYKLEVNGFSDVKKLVLIK